MVATFSTASCDDHHFWFSSKQKFLRKTLTLTNQFFVLVAKICQSVKKKFAATSSREFFKNFPKNSPHFEGKKLWNCQHFWRIWAYILAFLF
jgi:hypothetical protein